MRFRFIQVEKANYPIALMCRLLEVSTSGFWAWCRRPQSPRARGGPAPVGANPGQSYCFPPNLRQPSRSSRPEATGETVGRQRVARLMKAAGLRSHSRRPYRVTTDSNHQQPVAPNGLSRDFRANEANHKWAADISYVRTRSGWLYLAVVLDLYSVGSWAGRCPSASPGS